jgi:DNA polymerase III epsilon subunit family exonuclease
VSTVGDVVEPDQHGHTVAKRESEKAMFTDREKSCYLWAMDLEQSVFEVTFTAIDFETTGLYSATDKIVEFGAVSFMDGKVISTFDALVDPGVPVTAETLSITGITNEMLSGKPTIDIVLPDFIEFIGDSIIVAHNAAFDIGFLRAALQLTGMEDVKNPIVDTQQLAQKAFPGQRSYALQNLVTFLKIPPNQAHRALDDSIMCMKLFDACTREMSFMGDLPLSEVIT